MVALCLNATEDSQRLTAIVRRAEAHLEFREEAVGASPARNCIDQEVLLQRAVNDNIVEAIVDGRQPDHLKLADLLKPLPDRWDQQRAIAGVNERDAS